MLGFNLATDVLQFQLAGWISPMHLPSHTQELAVIADTSYRPLTRGR